MNGMNFILKVEMIFLIQRLQDYVLAFENFSKYLYTNSKLRTDAGPLMTISGNDVRVVKDEESCQSRLRKLSVLFFTIYIQLLLVIETRSFRERKIYSKMC